MKFLLTLTLVSCLLLPVVASERVTLSITITGAPANNDTITINASTRTNKTTVANPPYEIAISTNNIGGQTTNLWQHIASYPLTGPLNLQWVATNNFLMVGQPGNTISASASGSWATLTLSTQTVTSLQTVRVPISGEATMTARTNSADGLLQGIFNAPNYGNVVIEYDSPPMVNFLNKTSDQDVGGLITFNGGINLDGNYLFAPVLTNFFMQMSDRTTYTPNHGQINLFDSSNTLIGEIYSDEGYPWLSAAVHSPDAYELLNTTNATQLFGRLDLANTWAGLNTFSVGATGIGTNLNIWNSSTYGALTFHSGLKFTRYDLTSLANGPNSAIPIGTTNVYIKIASGPSAAFSLDGFAGGANGSYIIVENATGQAMTVAHQSGLEATAANRIVTMSGGDVSSAGNVMAAFIYDSGVSRWKMIMWEIGGGGGGVTGTGTAGVLAKFGSTSGLVDSIASESGYTITIAGNLVVATNISSIRGVSYTWPASQGAASTFLQNNGSGTLSWGVGSMTTINPSDTYIPQRYDATTFIDSPMLSNFGWSVLIRSTNTQDHSLIFSPVNTNSGTAFVGWDFADSDGQASAVQVNGLKGSGWGIGAAAQRDGVFSVNVQHDNALKLRMEMDGDTGLVRFIDRDGVDNILTVSNSSGWTGTGTKVFTDDGTFKTNLIGSKLYGVSSGWYTNSAIILTNVASGVLASGTNDLYTAPTGYKAFVGSMTMWTTNQNTAYRAEVKSSGDYYRLSTAANMTTNSGPLIFGTFVLEEGESVALITDKTGVRVMSSIYLIDKNNPIKTVKMLSFTGGDDLFYTVPTGNKLVSFSQIAPTTTSLTVTIRNSSGGARLYKHYLVPPGGIVEEANQYSVNVSVADGSSTTLSSGILQAGWSIYITSDSSAAGQWAYANVYEESE